MLCCVPMHDEALDAVLGRELQKVPELAAAYLFGSAARGDARPDSDIDIGLLYRTAPAATLEAQPFLLAAELASALGRPVDAVVLNTAPVDLVHRVLRDGRLVLEVDPESHGAKAGVVLGMTAYGTVGSAPLGLRARGVRR